MIRLGGRYCILFSLSWYSYDTRKVNKNAAKRNVLQSPVRHILNDIFPIKNGLKQGDSLLSLPFNFALDYAIRRLQANQVHISF